MNNDRINLMILALVGWTFALVLTARAIAEWAQ